MKKKVRFVVAALAALLIVNFVYVQPSRTMVPDKIRATWLWHTEQIQQKPDATIEFLASKKATVLFLQINRDIPSKDYASFIQKATAKGISVHALDGSSSWLSGKRGEERRTAFFKWIEVYQKSAQPTAQFAGIHLDVEPYVRASWNSDYEGTVKAYQQVLTEGKVVADRLGVEYGLDIPFWFDKRYYDNEFGKGTLSEWLIDTADQITIMAYRDKANGRNGILSLTKSELNYADSVKKQVLIGIETLQSSEGEYLSFYEEDEAYMNRELVKTEEALTGSESFEGFAIHSIDGWMNMK